VSAYAIIGGLAFLFCLCGSSTADDGKPQQLGGSDSEIHGDEAAPIFEQISTAIKTNQEKMKTWKSMWSLQQSIEFGDINQKDQLYTETMTGTVQMVIDFSSSEVYCQFSPASAPRYLDEKTGREIARDVAWGECRGVLTPEHFLDCDYGSHILVVPGFPVIPGIKPDRSRVVLRRPSRDKSAYSGHFHDARDFFRPESNVPTYWEMCARYAKQIRDRKLPPGIARDHVRLHTGISIVKKDGRTLYRVRSHYFRQPEGKEEVYVVETIFDASVGMNVVSYALIMAGDKLHKQRLLQYRNQDGIYIPMDVVWKSWDLYEPGAKFPRIARHFVLKESTLNERIDPKTFTLEEFGLRYGDRYADYIEKKQSIFDGTKLVPAKDFQLNPLLAPGGTESQNRSGLSRWLLIANALALFVFVSVVYLRRRRRKS
jgi:hypothetical protein